MRPRRRDDRSGVRVVALLGLLAGVAALLVGAIGRLAMMPAPFAWHAGLMLTAWGIMMPAGAVVARYFKVTPGQRFPAEIDNPFWWRWHRVLQYGGLLVSAVSLAVVLSATGVHAATWHGTCGFAVMGLGCSQLASALLRGSKGGPTDERADPAEPSTWRGDHYDMTPRRRLFEAWHKTMGWAAIGLAGLTILLGIGLLGAPSWLMAIAGIVQGGTILALVDGRLRRRWVDTYAALWGPDPMLGTGRGAPTHGAAWSTTSKENTGDTSE